ncbi:hypothetical protein ABZ470_33790 [Streptosporangium sp. NPDC020072]|uniref:hypothetical protein n=1 Tax=Streptosporangium sp. NPDC020072 TaxID=3154788 RepID=UPI00343E5A24
MTRWHRPLLLMSAIMAVLSVISLFGVLLDHRTLDGLPIWLKPLKFTLSFVAYGLTWAWLLSLRRTAQRASRLLGNVMAIACVVEITVIISQVIRGRHSHFNFSTALDSSLYALMGTTVMLLMLVNLAAAFLVLRERQATPADTWAIRVGLVVSAAGLGVAVLMLPPTSAQLADVTTTVLGAHGVGVPDGGPGLSLLGWSTTGGDLRVPHFFGMHALQALPLVALLTRGIRDQAVRLRLVLTAGASYTGLVALVTWQALRGQPLVRPDALTLGVAGLLLAGTAIAVPLCLLPLRGGRVSPAATTPAPALEPAESADDAREAAAVEA